MALFLWNQQSFFLVVMNTAVMVSYIQPLLRLVFKMIKLIKKKFTFKGSDLKTIKKFEDDKWTKLGDLLR